MISAIRTELWSNDKTKWRRRRKRQRDVKVSSRGQWRDRWRWSHRLVIKLIMGAPITQANFCYSPLLQRRNERPPGFTVWPEVCGQPCVYHLHLGSQEVICGTSSVIRQVWFMHHHWNELNADWVWEPDLIIQHPATFYHFVKSLMYEVHLISIVA